MTDTPNAATRIIAIAEAAKGGTTNAYMIGELDKIIKEAKSIDARARSDGSALSKHRKTKKPRT